jgi:predicted MFS family arabinose efflux permease
VFLGGSAVLCLAPLLWGSDRMLLHGRLVVGVLAAIVWPSYFATARRHAKRRRLP